MMNFAFRARQTHRAYQQAKRCTRNYTGYSQFAFANINQAVRYNMLV